MKKHPRIIDYIEIHHPNVHELCDFCPITNNLTSHKIKLLTFLSSEIKEIEEAIKNDEPEKISDILCRLVLENIEKEKISEI